MEIFKSFKFNTDTFLASEIKLPSYEGYLLILTSFFPHIPAGRRNSFSFCYLFLLPFSRGEVILPMLTPHFKPPRPCGFKPANNLANRGTRSNWVVNHPTFLGKNIGSTSSLYGFPTQNVMMILVLTMASWGKGVDPIAL